MGGSHFSSEKQNAREEILSGDLNRLQALSSRELQNVLADASTDVSGAPISGLSGPCSLTGIVASYQMALSAAQAFFWNIGDGSVTADDSFYEVLRWAAQNLTFGTPDGSNPRIDLVCAAPGMVDSDSQSRTVLVDPVARTVSPQNIYKRTDPSAAISVVAGTPSATPVPPAAPAGSFPLFEIWIPAAAADSTMFVVLPRIWRRAPFPLATMSGIVQGLHLKWDLTADPATTSSALSADPDVVAGTLRHRVLIDGELLDFPYVGAPAQDAGSNNPFASAAGSAWNVPYFVYACGGRHAPQAVKDPSNNPTPIALVESLVPPNDDGHPSAAITTPRGTTTQLGAVYVGLGSVVAGSTRRAACFMDADMTYHANQVSADNVLQHTPTGTGYQAFDTHAPPVVPAISTEAAVALMTSGAADGFATVSADRGDGGGPAPAFDSIGEVRTINHSSVGIGISRGRVPFNASAPKFWVAANDGATLGTISMAILGFDHRVRRLR